MRITLGTKPSVELGLEIIMEDKECGFDTFYF